VNPGKPSILPGMTFRQEDIDRFTGLVRTGRADQLTGEVRRVSPESVCPICKHAAIRHPLCGRVLDYNNQPFLNVLCGGERVKL